MGFYYDQNTNGFYYNKEAEQGFYYDKPEGFYYDGFYYEGFYYDDGFYYDRPDGFYYNQNEESGFYYNNFVPRQGFYYERDETDAHNPEFYTYWKNFGGRDRMLKALEGLRTLVDVHVLEHPQDPSPDMKRAVRDVVTVQVVRDCLKTFMIHVNPADFFKAGGDAEKLSVLLGRECQHALGPDKDYRKEWHEPGTKAESTLSEVTKDIIPFIIKWQNKEPFHPPNFAQLDVMANLVAKRLALEEMFKYASAQPVPKFGNFNRDVQKISDTIVNATFKRLTEQPIPADKVSKPAPKKAAAKKRPAKKGKSKK